MTENNLETVNNETPETTPIFKRPAVRKTLLVAGAAAGLFFAGAALARKNASMQTVESDEIVVEEIPTATVLES